MDIVLLRTFHCAAAEPIVLTSSSSSRSSELHAWQLTGQQVEGPLRSLLPERLLLLLLIVLVSPVRLLLLL
jgi:hypothetical protein